VSDDKFPGKITDNHLRLVSFWGVALVVLVFCVGAVSGLMLQRSADRDEINNLREALADAACPAETVAAQEALEQLERQSANHLATIEVERLYNKRLTNRLAMLEQQLADKSGQPEVDGEPGPVHVVPSPDGPVGEPAEDDVTPIRKEPALKAGHNWFVNFGSYNVRSTAESRAKKLRPLAGEAVVVPAEQGGKTFYRVRIIGLADRAQANEVAIDLQTVHGLPPLWIGKD